MTLPSGATHATHGFVWRVDPTISTKLIDQRKQLLGLGRGYTCHTLLTDHRLRSRRDHPGDDGGVKTIQAQACLARIVLPMKVRSQKPELTILSWTQPYQAKVDKLGRRGTSNSHRSRELLTATWVRVHPLLLMIKLFQHFAS